MSESQGVFVLTEQCIELGDDQSTNFGDEAMLSIFPLERLATESAALKYDLNTMDNRDSIIRVRFLPYCAFGILREARIVKQFG